MATAQLMLPANRAFDSNGLAISGAQAKLYTTGTSTPQNFYADAALVTSLGSTITANGAGRFEPAYQNSATPFRFKVLDSDGAVLDDIDPFYFGQNIYSVSGSVQAATRTALAALTATTTSSAYLSESGREGTFVWSSANNAANVTADPNQGIYVAPASDTTGASGAWVRKFSGRVNVLWFGAVADWNGSTGTDNGAAFLAALAYLNATATAGTYASGNVGLYIPKGKYWLNTTTLEIRTCLIIEGDSVGEAGAAPTFLKWTAGATGIRVQASNTTGASASQTQDNAKSGSASIIRNLYLEGSYTSVETETYGIQLRARASIRDCYVSNFEGDGIYVRATAGGSPEGNCNNFEISKVSVTGCRNGLYVVGGDVNAGMVTALDVMYNRAWGVNENGFLGNTYTACHTATNTSGPYRTTNNNGQNVFIGCYSEGDQPTSSFVYPTVVIGGLHAAGVAGTGAYLRNVSGSATSDSVSATNGSIDNLSVNIAGLYQNAAPLTMFSSYNGGNGLYLGSSLSFGGFVGTATGIKAFNPGTGLIALQLGGSSLAWMAADGANHLTVDSTHMGLTGYYDCDEGYKVDGTAIINGSGVLQAAGFPALTGDVTTAGGALATTVVAAATATGAVLTTSSSGIGYRTGAGSAVTQLTDKSTATPAINKPCGQITMNNASLASGAKVSFVVTNSTVAATDTVIVSVASGGTANAYRAAVTAISAGVSFTITVENITAGPLSEAPVINFSIIKAVAD